MSRFSRRLQLGSRHTTSTPPSYAIPVGGPSGITWAAPIFEDNFDGSSLNINKWASSWFNGGTMNEVSTSAANVSVSGGNLILTLASSSSGALVNTNPDDAAGTPFEMTTGYAEARMYFPGSGSTVYNWPAWWITGQDHPETGENDIAEGLGTMTVNYHSSAGDFNQGTIPGTWVNAFHTYAINRKVGSCDVYYDGNLVKSYATQDGEAPQYLIFNVGTKSSRTQVFGAAGQIRVDYVRVWDT